MAKRVWVLDVYDSGEHVGQYVFPTKSDVDKAALLIEEHEGLEEGDTRNGYTIGQYDPEKFSTWKRSYLDLVLPDKEP